jgi:predicted methyltransferase
MDKGFNKAKIQVNTEYLNKVIKKYKKTKKYMNSTIFEIKTMDGTETYVSSLIKEAQDDPPAI